LQTFYNSSDVGAVRVVVVGGVAHVVVVVVVDVVDVVVVVVVNIYCFKVSHALPGNDGIKKTGIMIIRKRHLDSICHS